jgi:hypothetical protein
MVFDILGATLKSFEVTATTCVLGDPAQREDTNIAGREATFTITDGDVFFVRRGAGPITGSFTTSRRPRTCPSTASRSCR